MSSNPYSDEPYLAQSVRPAGTRPGGLTVVAVLAIVLGVLGLMGACGGGVGLLATPYLQGAMKPAPGASSLERMQFELNQETLAINERYFALHMTVQVFLLIVAGCLTVGGIQVLRLRPGGRKFLIYTFFALIAFEFLRTVLLVFVQLQILPVVEAGMNRLLREAAGGKDEPMLKFMAQFTYAAAIFGMVVMLGWALIKIVIYGLSARYLSKPDIIGLFEAKK